MGQDGTGLREACEQMGILWVRGNFDENGQRHEEQPGLVFKKVQGGEEGSEAGGQMDLQDGGVGEEGWDETDRWMDGGE